MILTNSLPLFIKRAAKIFLISISTYLFSGFIQADRGIIIPEDVKQSIKTVVIDPGHGGKDPGAVGKKAKEKDIALAISLKLGKLIEENVDDVKVIYTRKTDVYPALYKRAAIANDADADLFISIHVNASTRTAAKGTSTHILGLHRTEEHFDVAMRENSVILLEEDHETRYQGFDPTSVESYIAFSLMQNTFLKQSVEMATYIQDQFREKSKRVDRGVVQQGLLVLAQTSMPAVLIETGFITNPEEETFLMTNYGQDLISSAIYRAFKQYKERIESNSNFTISEDVYAENKHIESEKADKDKTNIEEADNDESIRFLVQVASSKSLVEISGPDFKGYDNVVVVPQGKWYKYAIDGNWDYHLALEECKKIKTDFPGAFVIAIQKNEILPLNEALLKINN